MLENARCDGHAEISIRICAPLSREFPNRLGIRLDVVIELERPRDARSKYQCTALIVVMLTSPPVTSEAHTALLSTAWLRRRCSSIFLP